MISFEEVYERAIGLLKDPHLSRSYSTNKIRFQKEMYPFLRNGVSRITAPPFVAALLVEQQQPEGKMEIFEGAGQDSFTVSASPIDGAIVEFTLNGVSDEANYDAEKQTITFSRPLKEGEKAAIEWYSAGCFTGNFSNVNGKFPLDTLIERVTDMLSQALALEWAMRERNSYLDGVLNNLTDTDFKVYSPANALNSKKDWVKELRLELMNSQNKLDWQMRMINRSTYGY